MRSKLNFRLLIFASILFLIPIACSLLTTEISDLPAPTKASGEPSVIPITKISPGEPTAPPTEPLPPLPDFDQVLTFGGGGAGFFARILGIHRAQTLFLELQLMVSMPAFV